MSVGVASVGNEGGKKEARFCIIATQFVLSAVCAR